MRLIYLENKNILAQGQDVLSVDAADGTRTHMVSRTILSRMRLPIPPQRHIEISHS